MCPIRVHWHFKNNYMNQWRIKLTISNYNFNRNYSNWNMLVQHPGFNQKATTYSFNSTKLSTLGIQGNFLHSIQRMNNNFVFNNFFCLNPSVSKRKDSNNPEFKCMTKYFRDRTLFDLNLNSLTT